MKFVLIPQNSSNPVPLQRDLMLVGRQANCDLLLDHQTVSKVHCVLLKGDGVLLLRDLGSTNGCRVNGQRVKRAALVPDDILSIAIYKYRVQIGPEDEEPQAPAAPQPPREVTEIIEPGEEADDPPLQKSADDPQISLSDLPLLPE